MLSDAKILKAMHEGNIVVDPFNLRQLGTNSYDCRLGDWFYQSEPSSRVINIMDEEHVLFYWGYPLQMKNGIVISPGTTILAHTQEVVGGRNGYLAKMHARSTVARLGLSVCRCAGIGDVGYINRWTMEISNHTQTPIFLPVGFRVCQMVFEYVGETIKEYQGKYGKDDWRPEDMLPKPWNDWDKDMFSERT